MYIFAHLAIVFLVGCGVIVATDPHKENKKPILVSLTVGVVVCILFGGWWAVLTAVATAMVVYGYDRAS